MLTSRWICAATNIIVGVSIMDTTSFPKASSQDLRTRYARARKRSALSWAARFATVPLVVVPLLAFLSRPAAAQSANYCQEAEDRCLRRCEAASEENRREKCIDRCVDQAMACHADADRLREKTEKRRLQAFEQCLDRCQGLGFEGVPCMERCDREYNR